MLSWEAVQSGVDKVQPLGSSIITAKLFPYTHTVLYIIIGHSFNAHIQNNPHSSLKNKYRGERFRAKTTEQAATSLISTNDLPSAVVSAKYESSQAVFEHRSDENTAEVYTLLP